MSIGALLTLALLGAYHGINPGMGWLFAVSLGLQERSGRGVLRALPPIALGHAFSLALTVGLLMIGQVGLSGSALRSIMAVFLIGFGVFKLVRPRHPRWVGMRVGFRDLTVWSFLMATAHGAGLMLLPVFLLDEESIPCEGGNCHAAAGLNPTTWSEYLTGIGIHTGAMFLASGLIALVVYYKVGLEILRKAWFNLDYVWSASLILAGLFALFF